LNPGHSKKNIMSTELSRPLHNEMAEVILFLKEARVFLEGQGVTGDALYAARLTLEELLTNVLKYALPQNQRTSFDVRIAVSDKEVEVFVRDAGPAFDPHQAKRPDMDCRTEDVQPGGLGLHMIRTMAALVDYKREQDHNLTRVVIRR